MTDNEKELKKLELCWEYSIPYAITSGNEERVVVLKWPKKIPKTVPEDVKKFLLE